MSEAAIDLPSGLSEILAEELEAMVAGLRDPETREGYTDLLQAARGGSVPAGLAARLGDFLALGLGTGRFRRRHGPTIEQGLQRLYERTPRGRAALAAVSEASQALQILRGKSLEEISLRLRPPQGYALTIAVAGAELTLHLDPEAPMVHSVSVEL